MSLLKKAPDTITVERTAKLELSEGKTQNVRFKATYRRLSHKEAQATHEETLAATKSDDDVIARDLMGWQMPGSDGNPVEFSEEAVEDAMAIREYRQELINGWLEVQFGRDGLARKNGLRPGGFGRG